MIQGMKIYNSEQVKKSLEGAGFTDIKIHKNKKGWLCVVCKKIKMWCGIKKVDILFSRIS